MIGPNIIAKINPRMDKFSLSLFWDITRPKIPEHPQNKKNIFLFFKISLKKNFC